MLFHVFCEFADGSSKYLHLKTSSMKEAYRQAKRDYYASQVLWIISSLDPLCRSMGLEYTRLNSSKVASDKAALISEFTKSIDKERIKCFVDV
jgi:hypothetical protein